MMIETTRIVLIKNAGCHLQDIAMCITDLANLILGPPRGQNSPKGSKLKWKWQEKAQITTNRPAVMDQSLGVRLELREGIWAILLHVLATRLAWPEAPHQAQWFVLRNLQDVHCVPVCAPWWSDNCIFLPTQKGGASHGADLLYAFRGPCVSPIRGDSILSLEI